MSIDRADASRGSVDRILDLAEAALDEGNPGATLELCEQVLTSMPRHPGALFLSAEALRELGAWVEAELGYRRVLSLTPDHSPSWSALASLFFDQLRFEECRSAAYRALRLDVDNPEACYTRAMLRERQGDHDGALRDYIRASRADPVTWPLPVPLPDAIVESVVEEALRALHPSIRAYLANVALILEDTPAEEVCFAYEPPAPPGEILGFFSGVSLVDRSIEDPWTNLPSAIVLFRCNLQRLAWDPDKLVEELRITVFHEVGHFLGLDEADLEARGLD
jgi:predicted Zn-dependent protease with MMP-like domain